MPTSGYAFTSSQISVRFRAPYITSSINQQYRGIVAAGVYEGFDPATSVNPLGLDLNVGSAGRSSAVVASSLDPEAHITVHLDSDLEVDLSAYASKTVAVAILGSYAFPAETSATVFIYDLSTETPPTAACVLAEVDVPASGTIPAANIRLTRRSLPWDSRGRDATPMVSALRNGSPLLAPSATGIPDFWEQEDAATEVVFDSTDAQTAPSGFNLSFRASKVASGAGSVTGALVQKIGLPIPAGRRVRLKAAYWPVVAPSSGTPVIRAVFSDFAGVLTTTTELTLDGTTLGAWETYETFVTLELGTAPTVLKELRVDVTGVSYTVAGANSPIFYLTDLDVQVEQVGSATDVLATQSGESHHTKVRVYEGPYPGAANVSLTFTQPSAGVYETALTPSVFPPSHTFRIGGNTQIDNDLTVLGSANIGLVFGNQLDTAAPPPVLRLALGPVNAAGVDISKVGGDTRVKGTLQVDQTASFQQNATFVASALGSVFDTASAGALQLGPATATEVRLSKAGTSTVVKGPLSAEQNATFLASVLGSTFDTASAGIMLIGGTNATEVRISKAGVNTVVKGNLIVEGTTFSTETETVLIEDNYLYLNNGYTIPSSRKGGFVVNYLPTGTATTVSGAYTASTVETAGSGTFAAGDLIQVSGSDKNDGLYVVASHVGTTLTINPSAGAYWQNAFTAGVSDGAAIRQVHVSLLETGSSGSALPEAFVPWQVSSGSTLTDVATKTRTLAMQSAGTHDPGEVAFFDSNGQITTDPQLTFDNSTGNPVLRLRTGSDSATLVFTKVDDPVSDRIRYDNNLGKLFVDMSDLPILGVSSNGVTINTASTLTATLLLGNPADPANTLQFNPGVNGGFSIVSAGGALNGTGANSNTLQINSTTILSILAGLPMLDASTLTVYGNIAQSGNQFNARPPGSSNNYEWINRSGAGHEWYIENASIKGMLLTKSNDDAALSIGTAAIYPVAGLTVRSGTNAWASWGAKAPTPVNPATTGNHSFMGFLKGGTTTNVGYIGTDAGGIISGGVGDNFGIRAETDLLLMAGGATNSGDIKFYTKNGSSVFTTRATLTNDGTFGINNEPPVGVHLRVTAPEQAARVGFEVQALLGGTVAEDGVALLSYDRANTAYRPIQIAATTIALRPSGTTELMVTSTAVIVGGEDGSGVDGVLRAPNATAADTAGRRLTITSGNSTGTAVGGTLSFGVSPAGSSGTGVNAAVERMSITNSTFTVTNPTNLSHTVDIASQVHTSGVSKTINIGANGGSGSTTLIGIGSFGGTTINLTGTSITLQGSSAASTTTNIANHATLSTFTKAVNIGTGGASGSATTITIGSTFGTTTTVNGPLKIADRLQTLSDSTFLNRDILPDGMEWLSAFARAYPETSTGTTLNLPPGPIHGLELYPETGGNPSLILSFGAPSRSDATAIVRMRAGAAMFPNGKVGYNKATQSLTMTENTVLLEGGVIGTADTLLYFYVYFDTSKTSTANLYYLDGPKVSKLPPTATGAFGGTPTVGAADDYRYIGMLPWVAGTGTSAIGRNIWAGTRVEYRNNGLSRIRRVKLPSTGSGFFPDFNRGLTMATSTRYVAQGMRSQQLVASVSTLTASAPSSEYQVITFGVGTNYPDTILFMNGVNSTNKGIWTVLDTQLYDGSYRAGIYNPSGSAEATAFSGVFYKPLIDDYPTAKFLSIQHTFKIQGGNAADSTVTFTDLGGIDSPFFRLFETNTSSPQTFDTYMTYPRMISAYSPGVIFNNSGFTVTLDERAILDAIEEDLMDPAPATVPRMDA
jgi:hypothetical protein